MKTVLNLAVAFLLGMLMSGCVAEDIRLQQPTDQSKNPFEITPSEALANLDAYFEEVGDKRTRALGAFPKIKEIIPVINLRTRSEEKTDSSSEAQKLIYVANFDDGGGFAILAADKRIEAKVIGVSEVGNISQSLIDVIAEGELARPLYAECSFEGPGFFSAPNPEYEGETFLNPNTVDYYIPEQQDTLVGNLDTSHLTPLSEARNTTQYTLKEQIEEMILTYSISYASRPGNHPGVNDPNIEDRPVVNPGTEPGGGGYSYDPEVSVTTTENLLSTYKSWTQGKKNGDGLNKKFPSRRSCIIWGPRRVVPTGCFPLAIAKVMTYLKTPNSYSIDGYLINWNALHDSPTGLGTDDGPDLLYGIAEGCHSWYFYKGTFTFPKLAQIYMNHTGFKNVKLPSYNFADVKVMIDRKLPVIVYAIPHWDITRSHAWNIDGYRISTKSSGAIRNMVHCDFGNGGYCNGYYDDGIFDQKSSKNILDSDEEDQGTRRNYNKYLHIVKYEKW